MGNKYENLTAEEIKRKFEEIEEREEQLNLYEKDLVERTKEFKQRQEEIESNVTQIKLLRERYEAEAEKNKQQESEYYQYSEETPKRKIDMTKRRNLNVDLQQNDDDFMNFEKFHPRQSGTQNYNPFLEMDQILPTSAIIKESLSVIPKFDGTDVFKFVRAVRRIKNQFPLQIQREIVRLLKFKLSDRACLAVGDHEFNTIEEFLTRLKVVFATHRSSNYYKGSIIKFGKTQQ